LEIVDKIVAVCLAAALTLVLPHPASHHT